MSARLFPSSPGSHVASRAAPLLALSLSASASAELEKVEVTGQSNLSPLPRETKWD